jgi:N-acetyl-anhydromuramyl-L-alanine amidase AmpD
MLFISKQGYVDADRINIKIFHTIERRPMDKVNGIVVHQTGGSTAQSTFNSYQSVGANGAHFLIDKDGTIYQTASLRKTTDHVGKLKSKCLVKKTCSPIEFKKVFSMRNKYMELSRFESRKKFPDRYPDNSDSIGVELVGGIASGAGGNLIYEQVTDQQNDSLRWLVSELTDTLGVSMREIYRHPDLSYKVETEAKTAKWE